MSSLKSVIGRCNNRRTQAAAETLKNTPARARFSKGPPRRNNKGRTSNNRDGNSSGGGGGGRGRDRGGNSGGQGGQGQGRGRGGSKTQQTAVTARVITKIQHRQTQQESQTAKSKVATTAQALQYVDKTKLDKIHLPNDVLENITTLLEHLEVKVKNGLEMFVFKVKL